jgi:hypothetical protein
VLPYHDKVNGDKAHANGVLMWETGDAAPFTNVQPMGDHGIWITSSCPGLGLAKFGYGFNSNCMTKNQHAQCFTFNPRRKIDSSTSSWIATSVNGNGVHVINNLNPSSGNAPWSGAPAVDVSVNGETHIEMIALHLIYRQVSVLDYDVKKINGVNSLVSVAEYPRLHQLVESLLAARISLPINPNEEGDPAYTGSYGLKTIVKTWKGEEMVIISKKHEVSAGLWDDLLPTFLPAVNDWTVATWQHGPSQQLPCSCCRSAPTERAWDVGIDKEKSNMNAADKLALAETRRVQIGQRTLETQRPCRLGCSARGVADMIDKVTSTLRAAIGREEDPHPPICGGIHGMDDNGQPTTNVLRKGLSKFTSNVVTGRFPTLLTTTNRKEVTFKQLMKPICKKSSDLTDANMRTIAISLAPILEPKFGDMITAAKTGLTDHCGGFSGGDAAINQLDSLALAITRISIKDIEDKVVRLTPVPSIGNIGSYRTQLDKICAIAGAAATLTPSDINKILTAMRTGLTEIAANAAGDEMDNGGAGIMCGGVIRTDKRLLNKKAGKSMSTLQAIAMQVLQNVAPIPTVDNIEDYRSQMTGACKDQDDLDSITVPRMINVMTAMRNEFTTPEAKGRAIKAATRVMESKKVSNGKVDDQGTFICGGVVSAPAVAVTAAKATLATIVSQVALDEAPVPDAGNLVEYKTFMAPICPDAATLDVPKMKAILTRMRMPLNRRSIALAAAQQVAIVCAANLAANDQLRDLVVTMDSSNVLAAIDGNMEEFSGIIQTACADKTADGFATITDTKMNDMFNTIPSNDMAIQTAANAMMLVCDGAEFLFGTLTPTVPASAALLQVVTAAIDATIALPGGLAQYQVLMTPACKTKTVAGIATITSDRMQGIVDMIRTSYALSVATGMTIGQGRICGGVDGGFNANGVINPTQAAQLALLTLIQRVRAAPANAIASGSMVYWRRYMTPVCVNQRFSPFLKQPCLE